MRYAIIESGGKQYKAVEGKSIEVDKLDLEAGKKVELNVLLVADGDTVLVGKPSLSDAKVAATVVAQEKGDKITVFKYKPKIRYRVKTGHRQLLTRLQIDSIDVKGLAKSAPAEEAAPKAEPKAETPKASAPKAQKPKAEAKPAKKAASAKKPAAKKAAAKPKAKKK
ncbi:MAG: 50S ribosomal protein L21 [Anaerolineales bacterium]